MLIEPRRLDQGPNGCWAACIAGLTGLSHEDLAACIPRRDDGTLDESRGSDYHNAVNTYMRSHGWRLHYNGPDVPAGFSIGSGTSPRGLAHAVIVKDGELWHDPHPSRAGVIELRYFEIIVPILRTLDL